MYSRCSFNKSGSNRALLSISYDRNVQTFEKMEKNV